jgi:hypothetical protein
LAGSACSVAQSICLNLPVRHGRQPGEDIAEVSVGFDTVTAAALMIE